jgi:hypothetical protein
MSAEPFDDKARSEFATVIAGMLEIQKFAAGSASMDDAQGFPKRKPLGYVYGFIDAALRSLGQDMADPSVGGPITFHVIRKLWPDRVNEYMDFVVENVGKKDKALILGMMYGGQQFMDFRKPDAPAVPMGLARFLIEGN